ncbi:hypothetical protein Asppvi_002068 [Aspergillus pseudoviridinutans]|uniref:Transferase family-domain-containing protein n=1 Tax=Aspergillus pseudoviridinutans TaxID=1517512 RepID=A0A9P3B856_9EURO|nr:uncharacterized protein Asppvi_002068 [Aspergillus pseudoviridinutans]GIJ83249.1 hypothetical protein Asppvi_002068 [Aspergillus pseudoviridinutans]
MTGVCFGPYTLTPFDHIFPPFVYGICGISFQPQRLEDGVSILRNGISQLIDILPFLAGEVAPSNVSDKANAMQVRPSTKTSSLDSVLYMKCYPEFRLSSPPANSTPAADQGNEVGCREAFAKLTPEFKCSALPAPVSRFQLNVLADGIILCVMTSHAALDGSGLGALLNLLAVCCRNVPRSVQPFPTSMGAQAETRLFLENLARRYSTSGADLYEKNSTISGAGHGDLANHALASHNFVFSSERIAGLKSRCIGLLAMCHKESLPSQGVYVSSCDILSSLVWVCINQGRLATMQPMLPDFHSTLGIAVDTRQRCDPRLPTNYLGNSVVMMHAKVSASELQFLNDSDKRPGDTLTISDEEIRLLTQLALRIRSQISRVDNDYAGGVLSRVFHSTDWCSSRITPTDVMISSLRHWDSFELDFGQTLDRITTLDILPAPIPGTCLILPKRFNADGRETWDMTITLPAEEIEALRHNRLMKSILEQEYPLQPCQRVS